MKDDGFIRGIKKNMPMIYDIAVDRQHALVDLLCPMQPKLGVEVGVRYGDTSEHLLTKFPRMRLVLVDPYAPYQDTDHFFDKAEQDGIMAKAMDRLKAFASRTRWERKDSQAATDGFRAEGKIFDFVFIDANHAYDYVKKDIELWAPLIRAGGILCGHDFNLAGVKKAVIETATAFDVPIVHYNYLPEVWAIHI